MESKTHNLLAGRYEIIRPLGSGGMARVFLAHDQLLDREVAIKMLREQFEGDKELLEQFRREAKSAARLIHPYIINIYDVVASEEGQYIVMEYVEGTTLKTYLQQEKLGLNAILEIGVRLADALQHAHSRNIIHCDIKPQNILLDRHLNPKITDFGIAKMITGQTVVYSPSVMGSVHYISPEQYNGNRITNASDVYSLGVVLFEMLTGQVPFDGPTAVAVAMMHSERPVPSLKDYLEQVPEGLEAILQKAMAKRPEDRYSNGGELRKDLLALKMQLFPYSNADYTQELNALPVVGAGPVEEADPQATVIMHKPKNTEEPKIEAPSKKEGAGKAMAEKKKSKFGCLNLLIILTVLVVLASVAANSYFSGKRKMLPVPSVVNLTAVEAQKTLEQQGFKVELEEEFDSEKKFQPGRVMFQAPKAQEKRTQGSTITLTISKGTEQKKVPDLKDMTKEKVEQILEKAGFTLGKITYKHNPKEKRGAVLEQTPAANSDAPKGSAVDIVINQGDKPVPNIVGKKMGEATAILKAAGLTLGEIKTINDQSVGKGIVLATNPNAGTALSAGDKVSVTVSEGSVKDSAFVEFTVPGNKPARVQVVVVDNSGRNIVFSGTKEGGVRLRLKVEYNIPGKVQFYSEGRLVEEKSL